MNFFFELNEGIYTDVSMYKDWIDMIMSNETLPDYEFSPFPRPFLVRGTNGNGNIAAKPTFVAAIILLASVMTSMISFL